MVAIILSFAQEYGLGVPQIMLNIALTVYTVHVFGHLECVDSAL